MPEACPSGRIRFVVRVVPGSIPEGSHLDLGGSRERMPGSYPDGRVQSGALYDVIASDLLLRLGERPVGDQQLAVYGELQQLRLKSSNAAANAFRLLVAGRLG